MSIGRQISESVAAFINALENVHGIDFNKNGPFTAIEGCFANWRGTYEESLKLAYDSEVSPMLEVLKGFAQDARSLQTEFKDISRSRPETVSMDDHLRDIGNKKNKAQAFLIRLSKYVSGNGVVTKLRNYYQFTPFKK